AGVAVAVAAAVGPLFKVIPTGFYAQTLGLASLVALVAVLSASPSRTERARLVVAVGLCIAVSYAVYFVLSVAVAMVVVVTFTHGAWRHDRRFTLVLGVVGGLLSAVPVWASASAGALDELNTPGGVIEIPRAMLAALGVGAVVLLIGLVVGRRED